MEWKESATRCVVLRGGGRWSGVLAHVLAGLLPAGSQIHWAAGQGYDTAQETSALLMKRTNGLMIEVQPRLHDISADLAVDLGIVASASPAHLADTQAVVARFAPPRVLVEKPLAPSPDEAPALQAAPPSGTALIVNYEFRLASYIDQIVDLAPRAHIAEISVRWCDPASEDRGHSQKSVNWSTHIAYDQGSHVWSLLDRILPDHVVKAPWAKFTQTGQRLQCGAQLCPRGTDQVALQFDLSRRATTRERAIEITLKDATQICLDFSTEPGQLRQGSQVIDTQDLWAKRPRPLGRSLRAMLDLPAKDDALEPAQARALLAAPRCQTALVFAEAFKQAIDAQAEILLRSPNPDEQAIARQELFAHQLAASSFEPPDPDALTAFQRDLKAHQ